MPSSATGDHWPWAQGPFAEATSYCGKWMLFVRASRGIREPAEVQL